jgi:hypothetical protein
MIECGLKGLSTAQKDIRVLHFTRLFTVATVLGNQNVHPPEIHDFIEPSGCLAVVVVLESWTGPSKKSH